MMRNRRWRPLSREQRESTGAWIASQQTTNGELPWVPGGKMDPWDHIHAAMGLAVAGRFEEARAAYRFLADLQERDGAWPAERAGKRVVDATHQSNHAAYLATGLWHYQVACGDTDFVAEMWPTLRRAIDFVVRLQQPCGAIAWAVSP